MNPKIYFKMGLFFFCAGTSVSAQTLIWHPDPGTKIPDSLKDPTATANSDQIDHLQQESVRTKKEMDACNVLLENEIKILEAKSSRSYGAGEQDFSKRKPPAPMSKKDLNFCLTGCEELLKKEFNFTFNSKSLHQAKNKEEAISGHLGSCQIAESKYAAHLRDYSPSQKDRIENGFKACPISVSDLDFDIARNRVIQQKEECDAKKKTYTDTTLALSNAMDDANKYLIDHGLKKALDQVDPAACPKKP